MAQDIPMPDSTTNITNTSPTEPAAIPTTDAPSSSSSAPIIPLDSPQRTTPIHPSLPNIRIAPPSTHPPPPSTSILLHTPPQPSTSPTSSAHQTYLNPLTLQPLSQSDRSTHSFSHLQAQSADKSRAEILRERDAAAAQLRERIEERERTETDLERQLKRKEWEMKDLMSAKKQFEKKRAAKDERMRRKADAERSL